MSTKFSDRMGFTQARTNLQQDDIDTPLRNTLWNWVVQRCVRAKHLKGGSAWDEVISMLAMGFFKVPLNKVPRYDLQHALTWLEQSYEQLAWYDVYNLIEFLVRELGPRSWFPWDSAGLARDMNVILAEELSAYRFIDGILTPISSTAEVQAIEEAMAVAGRAGLDGVHAHIRAAVQKLGQKPQPDYRNSVKESISAVEAAARRISGKGGLKEALTELEKRFPLHQALKAGFLKLYGYTSDDDGIRHAIMDEPTVGFDEAKFMLVSCSAFANYLISKRGEASLLRK